MKLPGPAPSLLILILLATMFGCATTPTSNAHAWLEQRYRAACERAGFVAESDVATCVARGAGYQTSTLPDRQCVTAVGKQVSQAMCY